MSVGEWLTVGGIGWVTLAVVVGLIIGAVISGRNKQKPK